MRPESNDSRSTASSQTCTLGCSLHCPPVTYPPGLIISELHAVELEIDARNATIMCPLRRLRNTLVPAGKLPDVVLIEIFGLWIEEDPFSLKAQLTLASVSHRWRNVMMSERSFWSFIKICDNLRRPGLQDVPSAAPTDSYRYMATRVLLERTSPYPISVDISVDLTNGGLSNHTLDDIKRVLAHAPRIREFTCISVDHHVLELYIDKMLHELKPDFRMMRAYKLACLYTTGSYNVEHFFPHGLPSSLVELSLCNGLINWNCLETLALSKLHIVGDDINIPLDWRGVMVHLAPFLRDFRLHTNFIATVSPGSNIHMTQLQDLSFKLDLDSFLSFITYLQLPTSVRILCEQHYEGILVQPRPDDIIPFVNSHFGRVTENVAMSLSWLSEAFTFAMNKGSGMITLKRCYLNSRYLDWLISELDSTIAWSLETLTLFEFTENIVHEPLHWRILSSRLPRVSSIGLKTRPKDNSDEYCAPRTLASGLINTWAVSNRNVIFPMVTRLRLMETRLEDVEHPGEQQLLVALKARRRAGRPITQIHLDESSTISGEMRLAIGFHSKVFLEDREVPVQTHAYCGEVWKPVSGLSCARKFCRRRKLSERVHRWMKAKMTTPKAQMRVARSMTDSCLAFGDAMTTRCKTP
jgi:hypothetical protein